jgi:hypothetical protein
MNKRIITVGTTLIFCLVLHTQVKGQASQSRRFHAIVTAGFGLPRIPYSHFRTPVSVLGGCALNCRLFGRLYVQGNAAALYTFDMGTATDQEGDLKFNLEWASVDFLYHVRGVIKSNNHVLAGVGRYHLTQRFGNEEDDLMTTGLCLGMVNWRHWTRWSMVTEIRWHLLFEPSSNPQILTVTLGIFL